MDRILARTFKTPSNFALCSVTVTPQLKVSRLRTILGCDGSKDRAFRTIRCVSVSANTPGAALFPTTTARTANRAILSGAVKVTVARPFAFNFTDPRNSGVVSKFVRNFVVSADGLDEDDG